MCAITTYPSKNNTTARSKEEVSGFTKRALRNVERELVGDIEIDQEDDAIHSIEYPAMAARLDG